jgi:hypothetical protein
MEVHFTPEQEEKLSEIAAWGAKINPRSDDRVVGGSFYVR